MSRLGRDRGGRPPWGGEFWRHRPIEADDPDAVERFGHAAAGRRDGPAMMATGWTLAVMDVSSDGRWFGYLVDGFAAWRATPGYDAALGRRFLEQLLAELVDDPPGPGEDEFLALLARGNETDALFASARCWAASELLGLGVAPVMQMRLYRLVAASPLDVVSPASLAWAYDYAARHDLPAPWPH